MDDKHYKGILKRWDEDKGFGFIATERADVFFHMSALQDASRRPRAGDVLHYQLYRGDDGKVQAANVRIEDRNPAKPAARGTRVPRTESRRWPGQLLFFAIMLGGVALWAWFDQSEAPTASVVTSLLAPNSQERSRQSDSRFQCDGRRHCGEMASCAEARFFLANCPNTKMDGDGDGVPCERQWCGG